MAGLFDAAWDVLAPGMTVDSDSAAGPNIQLVFSLLKGFRTTFVEGSHPRLVSDKLSQRIMGRVLEHSRDALLLPTQDENTSRSMGILLEFIDILGDDLFTGADQAEVGVFAFDDLSFFLNIYHSLSCWMESYWNMLARC